MRKVVWLSTAVKAVILIIAAVLILLTWPFRVFRYQETQSVPVSSGTTSRLINRNNYVKQIFFANGTHMDSMRLCVLQGNEGTFEVRIFDLKQKQLAIEEIKIPETLPAYVRVPVDLDMIEDGQTPYFFKVSVPEDSDTGLTIAMEPWGANPNVIAVAYDNETPLQGMNYAADYTYSKPFDLLRSSLFIGTVLLVMFVLLALTDRVLEKKNRPVTVESVVKILANPLCAILVIVCIAAVFAGKVSLHKLDNGFALFATVLLACILFYAVNHDRTGQESILTKEYLRGHIPDFIQSAAIAFALQGCCEYVAGLYDIHHRVAERKEMFFFAFIILAMIPAKEIFRLYNLVYMAAAAVGGLIFYRKTLTPEMNPDEVFVLRMTVLIAILFGLILIRTVKGLIEKKLSRPDPFYGGLLLLYFAMTVILRNTRWWTVVLAAGFTLLYLNYGMWEKKGNFLTNVVRGVVAQFLYLTCWALIHRPYSTYRSARYTHFFHTATITATYMTTVCCIALVLLFAKLYRQQNADETRKGMAGLKDTLKGCWKELLFFGIVSSYLVFTMARTAYAAMLATALFAVILCSSGNGRKKLSNILKNICYCIAALLIVIPVVFEVQRTIPALASDPYTYDIEFYTDDTLRGRKLWSNEYMRVGRFVDVFSDKILGLPEGTFDIYGEMAEYRRTHPEGEDSASALFLADYKDPYADVKEAVRKAGDGRLYEDYDGDGIEDETPDEDYTNGRLSIYRSYLSQLNLTGHDHMGAILENGEEATHAHDVYLQVAFDHGIPVGILFVIFGIATLLTGIRFYLVKRDEEKYAALPAVVTVAFAVAGLVEWVYHLGHPMSFVLLLSITPLVFADLKGKNGRREGKKDKAAV